MTKKGRNIEFKYHRLGFQGAARQRPFMNSNIKGVGLGFVLTLLATETVAWFPDAIVIIHTHFIVFAFALIVPPHEGPVLLLLSV